MTSALIVVLGLWLVASPLVIPSPSVASWNSWIVAAIGLLCGTRLVRSGRIWQALLTFIASACTFVAAFIPRLQDGDGLIGRSIIFGTLLFVAGVCAISYRRHAEPAATHVS